MKKGQQYVGIVTTTLLVVLACSAMEKDEWEKTEALTPLIKAIENSATETPVTHYLYTPGTIYGGAYEQGKGNFESTFLDSVKRGATLYVNLAKPKESTLLQLVDMINFILFAAIANVKDIDFKGFVLSIKHTAKMGNSTDKLFTFFKKYAEKNAGNPKLCHANLKEKHLLIFLRPTPNQYHRSCWLGNCMFKSFEILLNDKSILFIKPTNAQQLEKTPSSLPATLNTTIKQLEETRNKILLSL